MNDRNSGAPHRVVVVGGGFGGLYAARALRRAAVETTLVDRRNFHLFQPLLYQVATGGLSPANIATPLRSLLRKQKQTRVLLGEAVDFDAAGRRVLLADGELKFDTLIVAVGVRFNYFGHDDWRRLAPGLKTIEDATDIRCRVLTAFESAERETDPARRRALLTFVIVGGGATGVELAGALAEVARHTLRHDFRSINPAEARIVLVEGRERLLPPFAEVLSARTAASLQRLGIEIRTAATVTGIQPHQVTLRQGETNETIDAATVLWTAGVRAVDLAQKLAATTGAATDRLGRIVVEPDLSLPQHPDIFAVGDMANYSHQDGQPLPGVAPVAMQQGQYVADVIQRRLEGRPVLDPFRYHDRGSMAVIGRAAAVADLGWIKLSGYPAWLAWLFIHLLYLAQFQNRLLVLVQWAWNYWTRNRAARLITGPWSEKPRDEG